MVGAGGVARGGTDALVGLRNQGIVVEVLVRCVSPELAAYPLVHVLCEGLREAVRQRLEHDGAVVVLLRLVCGDALRLPDAGGDGEPTEVVAEARRLRRDEVGEREVLGATTGAAGLLTERVDDGAHRRPCLVRVHLDVVADGVRGPQADDGPRGEPPLSHDLVEHLPCVGEQAARALAHGRVVEELRVRAGELPRLEERRPVDPVDQCLQRHLGDRQAEVVRHRRRVAFPRHRRGPRACLVDAVPVGRVLAVIERVADRLVLATHASHESVVLGGGEQVGDGADGARGIRDVHDGMRVVRRDLHRGVRLARGGATDQQR